MERHEAETEEERRDGGEREEVGSKMITNKTQRIGERDNKLFLFFSLLFSKVVTIETDTAEKFENRKKLYHETKRERERNSN